MLRISGLALAQYGIMTVTGIEKVLLTLIFCSLSYPISSHGINKSRSLTKQPSISYVQNLSNYLTTQKPLRASEIGRSSISPVLPTWLITQQKIVSPSDPSTQDDLQQTINRETKTPRSSKRVKTENFISKSLKISPNTTTIQPPTRLLDRYVTDKEKLAINVKYTPPHYGKDTLHIEDPKPTYIKDTPPIYVNDTQPTYVNTTPFYDKHTPPLYMKDTPTLTYFKGAIPHKERETTTKSPTYTKYIEPPQCLKNRSCKDRCGFKRQFSDNLSCFCDPDCNMLFKDCCEDFHEYCNATFMEKHKVVSRFAKRWNCTKIYKEDVPIWVIGQCTPDWNDADVLQRCTKHDIESMSISELIPVTDQNNNTFLNRYCAICNNVTSFTQWQFEVNCDVKPPRGIYRRTVVYVL